jgi:hypothetical protein
MRFGRLPGTANASTTVSAWLVENRASFVLFDSMQGAERGSGG